MCFISNVTLNSALGNYNITLLAIYTYNVYKNILS